MKTKLQNHAVLTVAVLLTVSVLLSAVCYILFVRVDYWDFLLDGRLVSFTMLGVVLQLVFSILLGWLFARWFAHRSVLAGVLARLFILAALGHMFWPFQYSLAILAVLDNIRPITQAPLWRQLAAWAGVTPSSLFSHGACLGMYAICSAKQKKKQIDK